MKSLEILTTLGEFKSFDSSLLGELKQSVKGDVLCKDDEGYEIARRVWNGMIDRFPAMIVRCTGAADVIAAVKFARKYDIKTSVRSGGHNVGGNAICDKGLVIDLSAMRSVRVDTAKRLVRAAGGARLGDIDHEVQVFGLAVPVGVVSATGVAGLSLHGGIGFLTRHFGMTCDNLVAADVVTSSGELVTADQNKNSDLLWAMKGGGSFGIVTSFEFKAHDLGNEVWAGVVMYPVEKAVKVLQTFRSLMENAPDELMGIAIYWNAPYEEFIPEEYQGKPVIVAVTIWSGDMDKGEETVRPVREIDTPVADLSGPMPYIELQKMFDPEYPDGRRYYWKSVYVDHLNEDLISVLSEFADSRPSSISSVDIWALGGAASRVKPEEAAFFQRTSPYLIGIEANWNEPEKDEANINWVRELFQSLQKFSKGGMYMNFPGFIEEGEDVVKKSYGQNYEKLLEVKMKYDPDGFFTHSLVVTG